MSEKWISAVCTAHRWNPWLTYNTADFLTKFLATPQSEVNVNAIVASALLRGVGLLAIASVSSAARRTALNGKALLFDAFLICAGLHKDHDAPRLSNGEYPACAAMTTGYVFRVENEATVHFLQRVGRTGQLTTLSVTNSASKELSESIEEILGWLCNVAVGVILARLWLLSDWCGFTALVLYIEIRLLNIYLIGRRATPGWRGQKEPGVKSDVLVLLTQDRWVRLQGLTDDIKATTSGQWLRQPTLLETLATNLTTMLSYLNVAIVAGASTEGQVLLLVLIFTTTMLVEVMNEMTTQLQMHGRWFTVIDRKPYERRLDMAKDLIKATGKDDWCEKMGIVLTKSSSIAGQSTGPAHM